MAMLIAGAGVVGLKLIEILEANDTDILGLVDDDQSKWDKDCGGHKVLGSPEAVAETLDEDFLEFSSAIGDPVNRYKMIQRMRKLFPHAICPNCIHPSAQISKHAHVGEGNIFCQNVVIQPEVTIGNFNSFNISAVMGPQSEMGNFCTMNALTMVASNSRVEDFSYLGMGCKVFCGGITVSRGTTVGANAFVNKNTEPWSVVIGLPAREIKKKDPFRCLQIHS